MKTMSVSKFSHNLREVLERMESEGDEIVITRRERVIAKLVPGTAEKTARDTFADIYGIIPGEEGENWLSDMRQFDRETDSKELRNPWE